MSGGTTSYYTLGEMKLIAANGPVSLRAHTDALKVHADKDVTIIGVNDEIRIQANQKIELAAGDSGIVLEGGNVKVLLLRDRQRAYSRHVAFFSIPQAVSHAEALIKLTARQTVPHSLHSAHQVTREWGDNNISQVVNERGGVPVAQRRAG